MVRIQIYDLHPSADKEPIDEISAGEMKRVQGGVLSNSMGREFSNSLEGNNPSTTTEPQSSRVNSLQEVNALLDNFRIELDKVFRRLV
ncbi:hypothetical protein NIES25_27400 [Nostoc linckia NIES-25]|nr:hypothetical protein NIES25_27400 [Nostoc linckia NIES-25]